jgi:ribosomal protein S18 acetylase RimI-like enzyme
VTKRKQLIQQEKHNPVWQQLLKVLSEMYEGELKLVFPSEWNDDCFSLFHSMEKSGFRRELHYSFDELLKNLENPELVFWFITEDNEPQIVVLGYSQLEKPTKSFYLDTFAVKPRGKGIGIVVMQFLVQWTKTKQYHSIVLDTEQKDEKGIPLQQFYTKLGFETVSKTKKGDLVMKLKL